MDSGAVVSVDAPPGSRDARAQAVTELRIQGTTHGTFVTDCVAQENTLRARIEPHPKASDESGNGGLAVSDDISFF
jgi:hypothetical protein